MLLPFFLSLFVVCARPNNSYKKAIIKLQRDETQWRKMNGEWKKKKKMKLIISISSRHGIRIHKWFRLYTYSDAHWFSSVVFSFRLFFYRLVLADFARQRKIWGNRDIRNRYKQSESLTKCCVLRLISLDLFRVFRKDRFSYFAEIRIHFLIENGQFWVASPLNVNHVEVSEDRARTSNCESEADGGAVRVCLQGTEQRQDFRS